MDDFIILFQNRMSEIEPDSKLLPINMDYYVYENVFCPSDN